MDRRLIQTAVVGSPDSDEPAIRPEDPEELTAFLKENAGTTWWCGVNLPGGCGRQRMTRLCHDKICHFAHYRAPDGDPGTPCGRQARGKDSADHLFMKADLAAWLKAQDIAATFDFPEPRGFAIVCDLADGRRLLVHLDRNQPVNWDDGQVTEFLLGTGVLIPQDRLVTRRYVHRIRYESERDGRRPLIIGTQRPGRTDWNDLRTLSLTPQGFTPAARPDQAEAGPAATDSTAPPKHPGERRSIVMLTRSGTAAATAARNHEAVQAAIRDLNRAGPDRLRDALATIEALLTQDASVEDRLHLTEALATGRRWLTLQNKRRTEVMLRLRRTEPGSLSRQLLEEAQQLTSDPEAPDEDRALVAELSDQYRTEADERLAAARRQRIQAEHQQQEELHRQRSELRQRQDQARAELEAAQQQKDAAPGAPVAAAAPQRRAAPAVASEYTELAKPLLGALKKAAREGETRSWESIADRTGTKGLRHLSHQAKVEVLVIAESRTTSDRPLWSVLLAAAGGQEALAVHRAVCERLRRPLPDTDEALRTRLAEERAILQHSW